MKAHRLTAVSLAFAAAGAALLSAFGQGSLTPPAGPAGPTMRTLTQVEPRIPLAAGSPGVTVNANGGFTIAASGSYYLTANLTVATGAGIIITSGGVFLDLMGFTIATTSTAAAADQGVFVNVEGSGVVVRNGCIRSTATFDSVAAQTSDSGFMNGVEGAINATAVTVSDLTTIGIRATAFVNCSTVERCHVRSAGQGTYNAGVVRDSTFERVRDGVVATGYSVISRCRVIAFGSAPANSVLQGRGIAAPIGTISECNVSVSGFSCVGIDTLAASGSSVNQCHVRVDSEAGSGTVVGIRNPIGQTTNCRVEATSASGGNVTGIDGTTGLVSHCLVTVAPGVGTRVAIKAGVGDACFVTGGSTSISNRYSMPVSP